MIAEDLEEYRVRVLEALRESGAMLRDRAEEIVGERVLEVQVHGSILYPGEFRESSDVDVAVVFGRPAPEGQDVYDPVQEWSEDLSRALPPVAGTQLDVCAFGRHGTPTGMAIWNSKEEDDG
jgi:predicted nucleotidyltransferase